MLRRKKPSKKEHEARMRPLYCLEGPSCGHRCHQRHRARRISFTSTYPSLSLLQPSVGRRPSDETKPTPQGRSNTGMCDVRHPPPLSMTRTLADILLLHYQVLRPTTPVPLPFRSLRSLLNGELLNLVWTSRTAIWFGYEVSLLLTLYSGP